MEPIEEALILAEEIIKNIELQEISLSNVVLRCARLARITNNQNAMDLFKYELTGYPKDDNGYVLADAFKLARYANRSFKQKNNDGAMIEYMFPETVAELENELWVAKEQMKVAFDNNVSISSANPTQYVMPPIGNNLERANLRQIITEKSKKIDKLRTAYYNYVLGVYYELKFKNITEDIFKKRKIIVDKTLSEYLPEAFKKFVSVYENLKTSNAEDWANAVHSCRRVIKDLADFLYPASEEEIEIGNDKKIKLNDENYIARLKQFIKTKKSSDSFLRVVGSHLDYIGDRIDSIYKSSTKGSHATVTQKEAESYVMYTYMLVGDIMDLYVEKTNKTYVWYAGYGSNLCEERFLCYITGEKFRLGGSKARGCSDKSLPIADKPIKIPHLLYFAKKSPGWDNKGVAFLCPEKEQDKNKWTLGRIWKITKQQFEEIREQEGPLWYNKQIPLGQNDGCKIFTITNEIILSPFEQPSENYIKTIELGLKETYNFTIQQSNIYLSERGIKKNETTNYGR